MLIQERLDIIIELLHQHNHLTVEFLVNELHYSHATIRRDLTRLVNAGYAKRSYGGISLQERSKPIMLREYEQNPEKTKLCKEAANLIKNNDTIFIAGSSTTRLLPKYLPTKKNITVVTHDIKLALEIEKLGINCYCTGGLLHEGTLTGFYAIKTLSNMKYDISFFSTSGISSTGEISVMSENFGMLMQEVIKRSHKTVCLTTANKFNKSEFFSLGTLGDITHVISNKTVEPTLSDAYTKTMFINVSKKD